MVESVSVVVAEATHWIVPEVRIAQVQRLRKFMVSGARILNGINDVKRAYFDAVQAGDVADLVERSWEKRLA
jgi:hypothetical protein